MKIIIDGDPYAYRAAYSKEVNSAEEGKEFVDGLFETTLFDVDPFFTEDDYTIYLTGKGNFRYDVATTHPYKGNRTSEKPEYLEEIRQHIIDNWAAVVSEGEEADDLIGIAATELYPNCVVVSIDKDMLQLPGTHFNPNTRVWKEVPVFEGLRFFYTQILTGDRADNIVGLYGIGPKKAEKMLMDCEDEDDLWQAVLEAYDGDVERLVENGRLLWLRRYPDQIWEPPVDETS